MSKPKVDRALVRRRKVKLVPPDKAQCQANKLSGCWPDAKHFMVIGPGKLTRCEKKPLFIVTEKKPGKDGQRGSMSLCAECFAEFLEQFGGDYAEVEPIK